MNKSDLQFIHTTLTMKRLFHEPSLHKTAQSSMEDVMSKVKGKVGELYNPEKPVESILSFLGPGILYMLGFKWMAVIYEIAAALGFNWENFFSTIKEKIKPILTDMAEGKSKDSLEINNIVQESAANSFQDQINPEQIGEIAEKYSSLNDLLFIKKVAQSYKDKPWIYKKILEWGHGLAGQRVRKGLLSFIIKVVSWILSAVLISAGFMLVGNTASKVLGIGKKKEEISTNQSDLTNPATQKKDIDTTKLVLNHDADSHLFTTTYNDDNHVWLLNFSVNDIKDTLVKWAQELYPQLTDKSAFDSSSAFNHTLQMFQDRNKNSSQVQILAVPQPFKSIKEIVDSFAGDVASHTKNTSKDDAIYA